MLFGLFEVTSDVAADSLGPKTNVKGKFLAEKLCNNDTVIYLEDPNWKNSSMSSYVHVLGDSDGNVVTAFVKKSVTVQEAP